jgi:hypothetical protein
MDVLQPSVASADLYTQPKGLRPWMVMDARPEAATAASRLIVVAVPLPHAVLRPRGTLPSDYLVALRHFTNDHQTLEQVMGVTDAVYTVRRDLETHSRAVPIHPAGEVERNRSLENHGRQSDDGQEGD